MDPAYEDAVKETQEKYDAKVLEEMQKPQQEEGLLKDNWT